MFDGIQINTKSRGGKNSIKVGIKQRRFMAEKEKKIFCAFKLLQQKFSTQLKTNIWDVECVLVKLVMILRTAEMGIFYTTVLGCCRSALQSNCLLSLSLSLSLSIESVRFHALSLPLSLSFVEIVPHHHLVQARRCWFVQHVWDKIVKYQKLLFSIFVVVSFLLSFSLLLPPQPSFPSFQWLSHSITFHSRGGERDPEYSTQVGSFPNHVICQNLAYTSGLEGTEGFASNKRQPIWKEGK